MRFLIHWFFKIKFLNWLFLVPKKKKKIGWFLMSYVSKLIGSCGGGVLLGMSRS